MVGFEPRAFGIGGHRSANRAKTAVQKKTFCYYLRKTRLTKLSESILTFINFIFPLSGLQIGLVN